MNMNQIKAFARRKGLRPRQQKKAELIRSIQAAENNPVCYMTHQVDNCGETSCLWRSDCR
jgi:hypothetical protein